MLQSNVSYIIAFKKARKLNDIFKVNSSTMDCIKKELEYTTQELSIQRDQASNQKAEFEKEIERLLFDNREIKEQTRKTQRELSKEITSLTDELRDERDRIHELQKENRKLRQEVSPIEFEFHNRRSF